MYFLVKIVITGKNHKIKENFLNKISGKIINTDAGVTFGLVQREIENRDMRFQLWNLRPNKRFEKAREIYYPGSFGGIVVIDLDIEDPIAVCERWIKEIWDNNWDRKIPIAIYGNLINQEDRIKPRSFMESYAKTLSNQTKQYGYPIKYFEGSFAEGEHIEDIFIYLATSFIQFN